MQSALNQSPRLLATVQRVSSSSFSCSTSSVVWSVSTTPRTTSAPRLPLSTATTTTTTSPQRVSYSAPSTTAPRSLLLRRAFSTQVPSLDQKHTSLSTTHVANETIESLLSKSLHKQDSDLQAGKKEKKTKAEAGPLDGIRVLDLTRVLGRKRPSCRFFFVFFLVRSFGPPTILFSGVTQLTDCPLILLPVLFFVFICLRKLI